MLRFKRLNPIKHGENNNVSVKDGIEYHLILNIFVRTVLAPVVLTVIY